MGATTETPRGPSTAAVVSTAAPLADPRLDALHTLIESGAYDVLSLDVFDTLVWRQVPTPADVHVVTARLLRERGALWESATPESFARERVLAEERARRAEPSHEVTLAEIWACFPRGYLRGIGREEGAAAELEAEHLLVRPHAGVVALARAARARGLKVALVSDTYHSARDLARLVPIEPDFLLASCEHRVSKFHGLHRVLLAQARVPAARVLHVGDNRVADVDGPEPLGVHRFWLPRFPEEWEAIVEAELHGARATRARLVAHGDDGLTALRGRVLFTCATPHARWGAGVLGPLMAGFADWVVERCVEVGARTVLCLMREGRVLRSAIDHTGAGLEAHECFVSRYAALRAAVFEADEAELAAFLQRPSIQRREVVLGQLGLTLADFGDAPPPERLDPAATEVLIRRVAGTPALRRAVRRATAEARAHLLAHLDPLVEGRGPRVVAVVDLGYKGTIQGALQRIFDRERPAWTTHGLYFVTGGEVHQTQASGAVVEGWLAENGQPVAMAQSFMRSPEVVEQSLMAGCGTTIGHRADGSPILDAFQIPDDQRAAIAEVQLGLDAYLRAWRDHRRTHGVQDPARLLPLYREICQRAIARPSDLELALFADWRHDENFGSGATRGIAEVKDLHPWEAWHLSAHQLASLPSSRVHWPFGYAHRVSRTMGDAVAHIHLRTASPEVFDDPGPGRMLVFYWDDGAGFTSARSNAHAYRMSSRGRAWVRERLALDRSSCHAVAFSVGVTGECVRLTGARVHVHPAGGVTATTDHPRATLVTHGLEHLQGDLFVVREEPTLIVVPTPGLEGWTGTLEVDLFFSVLEAEGCPS